MLDDLLQMLREESFRGVRQNGKIYLIDAEDLTFELPETVGALAGFISLYFDEEGDPHQVAEELMRKYGSKLSVEEFDEICNW